MKKSDELKIKIQNLLDEGELIHKSGEGRELTTAETSRFHACMAQVESLQSEYAAAKKLEDDVRLLRASQASLQPTPESVYNLPGQHTSQPNLIRPTLRSFRAATRDQAERDAHDVGLWFLGRVQGESEALRKLESRRGTSWLATQNEASPTSGGYLVPAPLAAAIMVSRQEVGALRKLARIVPMGSETLTIPKQTDGTTVYYPGEEGSITASDLDFARVSLQCKKRAIYSLVSNELREDSIVPIIDLLAQDMGHQFALQEDNEGIDGDGTSTFGGVLGIEAAVTAATASIHTAATGHDTWPELDFSDFAGVMAKLPAKYRVGNNLKWLVSPAFKWAVMDRLAIGANGAASQVFVDGVPQDRFLGYEVVLSDDMPTATAVSTLCAVFGNFDRAVLLGERNEVRVALSEHIAFQTDQTAVRATVRYDINVHEAGDTSTAGAIVGLKTAS